MKSSITPLLALALLCLGRFALLAQPASRLGDFNTMSAESSSLPGRPLAGDQFAFAGGLGFFVADDGVTGHELWVTDATLGGTRLVREIRPGYTTPGTAWDPRIDQLTALGARVLFTAATKFNGNGWNDQLWTSDGTAAGTIPVSYPNRDLAHADSLEILGHRQGLRGPQPQAFVAARSGDYGYDLWLTDGRAEGTQRLSQSTRREDGVERSSAGTAAMLGDTLIYASSTRELGAELWRSDGTPEGTRLLKDIRPGLEANPAGGERGRSSFPNGFVTAGPRVYFVAQTDENGTELWSTDGTAAGTRLARDFSPGELAPGQPRHSDLSLDSAAELDGELLFTAPQTILRDGQPVDVASLWRTDGTDAGTRLHASEFTIHAPPAAAGGKVWLLGYNNAGSGLFVADANGLRFVDQAMEPLAGAGNQVFAINRWGNLLVVNAATEGITGGGTFFNSETGESHEVDRVGPLTSELSPGTPATFAAFGNQLFFSLDLGTIGREPWTSDGTAAGTKSLKDIHRGNLGFLYSSPRDPVFINAGNRAYFFAQSHDPKVGDACWETAGTAASTRRVTGGLFSPGANQNAPWGAEFGGELFVSGGQLDVNERLSDLEPYRVTAGTATQVHDLHPEPSDTELNRSSAPAALVQSGPYLYFATALGELWRTDGTPNGALMLAEFGSQAPFGLTDFHGMLVFVVNHTDPETSAQSIQLWKSSGTAGGTEFVGTLPGSATPPLQVVGDRVMIFADPGFYVSDGTAAGTGPLTLPAEIGTMLGFHGRDGFPVFQGQLWFSASGRSQLPGDMGLWRTDGTTGGTTKIRPLNQGVQLWQVVGNRLYFTSEQNVPDPEPNPFPLFLDSVAEIWRTDGTSAGTELITYDLSERNVVRRIYGLAAVDDVLYFVKVEPVHGAELWRCDGTAAGTVLVQDLAPGVNSGFDVNAMQYGFQTALVGDRFLFAAEDERGVDPWTLDLNSRHLAPPKFQPWPAEIVTYLKEPFSFSPTLQSGGPANWAAHDVPSGLELDPNTGQLSGQPTYPGTYQVTLDAANQGATGVMQFTMKVLPPPVLQPGLSPEGLALAVYGEPGQRFDLEATTDFRTWNKVRTDLGVGDAHTITFPEMQVGRLSFYRLLVR